MKLLLELELFDFVVGEELFHQSFVRLRRAAGLKAEGDSVLRFDLAMASNVQAALLKHLLDGY